VNKLEEITKLRAQGMSLAEAREKVVGPPPKQVVDEAALLLRALHVNRIIELRKTGLPLADAKAQADREFNKHQ
jgi:DNA-binding transcriptional MerR regulator